MIFKMDYETLINESYKLILAIEEMIKAMLETETEILKRSIQEEGEVMNEFVCGNCVNNDDGLCDFIGVLVGDDDSPHCSYGKGWSNFDNFTKKGTKKEGSQHDD